MSAAGRVERDEADDPDLQTLFHGGSSLGGARPKAHVRDQQGRLGITKFPSPSKDDWDVMCWESVALSLARRAGISIPTFSLHQIDGRSVLIVDRFDRHRDQRIGYVSAMTMLEANDGDQGSYLEIADVIERKSVQAEVDLIELWRRIAFSILISNTDDHLRNHGFLRTSSAGWTLSPAFDLNPDPSPAPEPTFHEFAAEWLESRRHEFAVRTVEDYTLALTNHLLPFFKDHSLSQITAKEVDRYKAAKVCEREHGGVDRPLLGLNDAERGVQVLVMQRLHEADLTGHLLSRGDFEHLCLPAEFEPSHPFLWPEDPRTEPGEVLWSKSRQAHPVLGQRDRRARRAAHPLGRDRRAQDHGAARGLHRARRTAPAHRGPEHRAGCTARLRLPRSAAPARSRSPQANVGATASTPGASAKPTEHCT